jgi:hypothetical protein
MSKIPLGKKCPICGKVHIVKPLEDVDPKDRKKIKKLDHWIFKEGYYGSLVLKNEVWEFYEPLVKAKVQIKTVREEPEEEPEPGDYESTEYWQQEMDFWDEEEDY